MSHAEWNSKQYPSIEDTGGRGRRMASLRPAWDTEQNLILRGKIKNFGGDEISLIIVTATSKNLKT